jgi:hypothetical protein
MQDQVIASRAPHSACLGTRGSWPEEAGNGGSGTLRIGGATSRRQAYRRFLFNFLAHAILFSERLTGIIVGFVSEPEISENLRKLHGLLRWLAADRSAWTPGWAREAVSLQYRKSMFNLQRTSPASMPRIRLRMAHSIKPAARVDASGQIRHDHACGQFYLARFAGRRGGRGRRTSQEKGVGLAVEVQFGKKEIADLSSERGLVCLRSSGVSGRDF